MANVQSKSSGIGFCGLLTVAFIVLKLIDVISWSWIWVLCPIWISLCLSLIIIVIVGLICAVALYIERRK